MCAIGLDDGTPFVEIRQWSSGLGGRRVLGCMLAAILGNGALEDVENPTTDLPFSSAAALTSS
jgi:hypothetical protein